MAFVAKLLAESASIGAEPSDTAYSVSNMSPRRRQIREGWSGRQRTNRSNLTACD